MRTVGARYDSEDAVKLPRLCNIEPFDLGMADRTAKDASDQCAGMIQISGIARGR